MKYTFEFLQENADLARKLLFENYCEVERFRALGKSSSEIYNPNEDGDFAIWKIKTIDKIRTKVINSTIFIDAWNKCDFARCEKMLEEGLTTETKQQ